MMTNINQTWEIYFYSHCIYYIIMYIKYMYLHIYLPVEKLKDYLDLEITCFLQF